MQYVTMGYAHINEARNHLLTHWYDKTDATHLLFVDADMGFEPQLILDMIAFDKPVTGVIYTKRKMNLKRLAAAAKSEPPERAIAQAHDFIIRPVRGRAPRRMKGFVEVEACGTGVMLIKREAITTMLKALPQLNDTKAPKNSPLAAGLSRLIRAFDTITIDGMHLMDDFAFCHRWRVLCKGEVWACTDQAVTHVGLYKYGARYADAGGGGPRIISKDIPLKAAFAKPTASNGKARPGAKVFSGRLTTTQPGKPARK